MRISVYGSAFCDVSAPENIAEINVKARALGKVIGQRNHILVSGGCTGLPYEATLGAKEVGGITIGYSPGISLEDHIKRFGFPTEGFDELVFVQKDYAFADDKWSCFKYRNISQLRGSDAAVIVGGGLGTANEFTLAYARNIPIGVLKGTGGITDSWTLMTESLLRKSTSKSIICKVDPEELVKRLEQIVETK